MEQFASLSLLESRQSGHSDTKALEIFTRTVMRFQRFRYLWIWQAGVVAMSGRNTVVLKLPAGEYFQRFGVALITLRAQGRGEGVPDAVRMA